MKQSEIKEIKSQVQNIQSLCIKHKVQLYPQNKASKFGSGIPGSAPLRIPNVIINGIQPQRKANKQMLHNWETCLVILPAINDYKVQL